MKSFLVLLVQFILNLLWIMYNRSNLLIKMRPKTPLYICGTFLKSGQVKIWLNTKEIIPESCFCSFAPIRNQSDRSLIIYYVHAQEVNNFLITAHSNQTGTMVSQQNMVWSYPNHQVQWGLAGPHHLHRWWIVVIWAPITLVHTAPPCRLHHQILLLGSTKVPSHMMS